MKKPASAKRLTRAQRAWLDRIHPKLYWLRRDLGSRGTGWAYAKSRPCIDSLIALGLVEELFTDQFRLTNEGRAARTALKLEAERGTR